MEIERNPVVERKVSAIIYLCYVFQLSVVGLVIWLVMRKDSRFIQRHGQQALSLYVIFLFIVLVTYSLGGTLQLLMLMALGFGIGYIYLASQAYQGKENFAGFLKHTL
ncbi:DUF4870 domain-containing protein [Bacillaceae bacterium W0354]